MWHTHFYSLSVSASHFFIIPRSIDSSASSSAHALQPARSHLGSDRRGDGGQEVQCQPIGTPFSSRCHAEREGQSCWQRRGEKTDHFIYHSHPGRRDQTSVCMIEESHQSVRSKPRCYVNQISASQFLVLERYNWYVEETAGFSVYFVTEILVKVFFFQHWLVFRQLREKCSSLIKKAKFYLTQRGFGKPLNPFVSNISKNLCWLCCSWQIWSVGLF